ncbi:MAG: glycosyltransferase family 39 protein [Bacteroidales bacterium]
MNSNRTYLILTLTAVLGLLLPSLVQEGMFLDGLTYAAVSKNLANGLGSFWNPHYTQTLYPSFHEHPPLVFIIQSGFFRVFGDGFLTERIYCLFIAILTITGITLCWRLMAQESELRGQFWLPVLIWITTPLIPWAYTNNLLENTMGVFTLFSVYFILKAIMENRPAWIIPGSIFILAAFLSKGFVGLFPLITPLLFGFIYKSRRPFLLFLYLVLSVAAFSLILMLISPEFITNIRLYFDQQLIPALNNEREISAHYRGRILVHLLLELTLPLIIILVLIITHRKTSGHWAPLRQNRFLLLILIAFSASIPLIISMKQRNFYLIPSIPFYAMAFSLLIHGLWKRKTLKMPARAKKAIQLLSLAALMSIILLSVLNYGKFSRDEEQLRDVYAISRHFPEGTILSTTHDLWSDWNLTAYLSRVGAISLDCDHQREYFLLDKGSHAAIAEGYAPAGVVLEGYLLFSILGQRGGGRPVSL